MAQSSPEGIILSKGSTLVKMEVYLTEAEERGKSIVEYLKKYEGQPTYNDIALAIQFGYQLKLNEEPKEETLEDKLESLVVKWHQLQLHYQDVAEDNITHEHTNRKFTYKAMATRDCWKELLTLLNESKNE